MRISSFAPPATSARGFSEDRFLAAAAELPAQRRDDAERTGVVATFRNFQVGGGAWRRDEARQEVVLRFRFEVEPHGPAPGLDIVEHLGDARVGAGADDPVDLRDQTLQLRAVPLRETPRNDQLLTRPFLGRVLEDNLR